MTNGISIKSNGDIGEDILPYCPPAVYEQLEKDFNLNTLMTYNAKNNDEHIGYIKGVLAMLGRVKVLSNLYEE